MTLAHLIQYHRTTPTPTPTAQQIADAMIANHMATPTQPHHPVYLSDEVLDLIAAHLTKTEAFNTPKETNQ